MSEPIEIKLADYIELVKKQKKFLSEPEHQQRTIECIVERVGEGGREYAECTHMDGYFIGAGPFNNQKRFYVYKNHYKDLEK